MAGKIYLVGAGPGSPDLITVRGRRILRQAEVVIYDYLVNQEILSEVQPRAELICCDKLAKKGSYSDGFLIQQEKIHRLMVKMAKQGKKVIRLKNGDPAIFSRLSGELEALVKNKIDFEIVPGVTAASAASAFSGIPLTDRRFASSCVFATGHLSLAKKENSIDWKNIAGFGTIVLYMAVENLKLIAEELIKLGKSKTTPVAIVKDASLPWQKITLGTLAKISQKAKAAKVKPPAIIIIGEVVRLEKKFNWFKKTKRVLFTGISSQRFFTNELVFHLPLIKIIPLRDYRRMDVQLKDIGKYDWIIFTSRYGAQYFFQRLQRIGLDSRQLKGAKVAAIGQSTKNQLLDFGIAADLVPIDESSSGLIKAFKKYDLGGKRIFLTRSDLSDKGLAQALETQGGEVLACVCYRNIPAQNLPDLDLQFFNEIMFTSPSTVKSFKARYKKIPAGVKVRCIGKVTRKQAVKQGFINE